MITKKKNRSSDPGISRAEKTPETTKSVTESPQKSMVNTVNREKEASEADSSSTRKALTFFVDGEGNILWDRMRDGTKDELREFIKRPDVRKNLGLDAIAESGKGEALAIGDDEANALLDLLGAIDSIAASKFYGISPEITSTAFAFTTDHRKKINPPLTRVLNKWAPLMLKTWKDEIGLGIVFFSVLNTQVRVMHMLEERRKKNLPVKIPASNVTPISEAAAPPPPKAAEKEVAKVPDMLETVGINAS